MSSGITVQEELVLKDGILTADAAQVKPHLDTITAVDVHKKQKKEDRPIRDREIQREILLLENDPTVSHELDAIFSGYKCRISIVYTREKFLDKAAHHSVDLIILKHFISGTNMEDLATRLKEMPKFYKIPIILYDNLFQETAEESSPAEKKGVLILRDEGKKLLEKAKTLLGL
jgi:CheY-like chemotaxis protein